MNTFQAHLLAYMGSATMVVHNQCLSTILNCWNVKKIVGLHPTMAIFFSFPSTGLTKTDVYCYTVHKRDTTRCVTRLNCVTPDVLKRLWSCSITTPHVHLSQVSESWHRFDVFVQWSNHIDPKEGRSWRPINVNISRVRICGCNPVGWVPVAMAVVWRETVQCQCTADIHRASLR